jgi:hypothetical protein
MDGSEKNIQTSLRLTEPREAISPPMKNHWVHRPNKVTLRKRLIEVAYESLHIRQDLIGRVTWGAIYLNFIILQAWKILPSICPA